MAKLKKWIVTVPIISATGERAYDVEANSAEEAIAKVESGEVECRDEYCETEIDGDTENWEVEEAK